MAKKALTGVEALKEVLKTEKLQEQGETLKVLDELRRSRRARGGVGAPLEIPSHLNERVQTILITDALDVEQR